MSRHGGHTVAEFPLTAGVVGVMLAPALAAIGAVVDLEAPVIAVLWLGPRVAEALR